MSKKALPANLQAWVIARNRHRLSHLHVFMAREIGLNPNKLGSIAPNPHELWKSSLPDFIENIYEKRFGLARPENVLTIEQVAANIQKKKLERKTRREEERKIAKVEEDVAEEAKES